MALHSAPQPPDPQRDPPAHPDPIIPPAPSHRPPFIEPERPGREEPQRIEDPPRRDPNDSPTPGTPKREEIIPPGRVVLFESERTHATPDALRHCV